MSRAWAKAALGGGTVVTVDAAGGSVLTVVTFGSAFELPTAASALRGCGGATGEAARGAPGPFMIAVSGMRTGAPRFGEALAGMIGGGIVARGCAGRGSA